MLRQVAFAVGLVCAALLALASQGSGAIRKPRNGLIAWDRNFEIYTMTPKRTHLRRLTHIGADSSGYDSAPAFSPDGKQIAFAHSTVGNLEIWVMNADGTHQHLMPGWDPIWDWANYPAFSPDGTRIAFEARGPGQGPVGIWVVGTNGRGRRKLTGGAIDSHLSWSPDGKKIAYTGPGGVIWVVPVAGGKPKQLTAGGGYHDTDPAWSPDGSKIAFSTDRSGTQSDIWVVDANGDDERPVSITPDRDDFDPAWSPDGRWLVFDSSGAYNAQASNLFVIRSDGSHLHRFTRDPGSSGALNENPTWAQRLN